MEHLAAVLEKRAEDWAETPAYIFLKGDSESRRYTFGELRQLARSYCAHLRREIPAGEHALLILPDEDVFLPVFWGCLYAGLVAVPTPAVDVSSAARMVPRLKAILVNSESRYILTTQSVRDAMIQKLGDDRLEGIQWILVDQLPLEAVAEANHAPLTSESPALLQYTSGSTSSPKGILLTHGNILHNFKTVDFFMAQYYPNLKNRVVVTWLPYYHDMGLIGTMLQTIYSHCTTVILKPLEFLQRPIRWLRAITQYRGTTLTGPNFGYELCRKRVSDEDLKSLDLSTVAISMNGSETVRWDSLKNFAEKFKKCGFRFETFAPVYGLAESTLFVTGAAPGKMAVKTVKLKSLEGRHPELVAEGSPKSTQVVSCGPCLDQDLRIVDPERGVEVPHGEIGEIWVSGKAVSSGYWKLPELSERTFGAKLDSQPGRTYLRTGDLGFVIDGLLYFAGRIKDLIIINGKNHYPQDIELTAEQAHPLVRAGCSVAFSTSVRDEEQVVLVVEAKVPARSKDVATIRDTVMRAVVTTHGVAIHDLVLIQPGTIYKTSSGKVQRQLTKKMWATHGLIRLDSMPWMRLWAKYKLMRYLRAHF